MALAQAQSPFEAMPTELHFHVLSHMSGPEDVLSTIQASPAALRALQTGRERIYAAVIKTRLAPEVFREFLAILNAPDHNTCPRVGPRQTDDEWDADRESILQEWKGWELKAGEFLRSHARGAVYSIPSPRANPTEFKTQASFMVRLYFCVSRLISYYIPYAGSVVSGTRINLPPMADFEFPLPTELELLRMQRGLLRYELCSRLIGMPSIAAYSNTRVFDAVIAEQQRGIREFWEVNPFNRLLPVDEMEEVICASMYVDGLYSRLRYSFIEDFQEAIIDLDQNRDEDHGDSEDTKTVRDWLSFQPLKADYYHAFSCGGEFARRLGLVFLDRVLHSTPADRREFMRTGDHTFRRLGDETYFLENSWYNVVYRRGFRPSRRRSSRLKVGPQCNDLLKTCSTHHSITKLLTTSTDGPYALRSQGWAFFDGESELRSLDLPDGDRSSIRDWLNEQLYYPQPFYSLHISEIADSALAARFTEEEWNLLFEDYSPKDLGEDFQAMSRFVADARAVVDFRSDGVPQMD